MLCPHCHSAIDQAYVLAELKNEEVASLSREQLILKISRWQAEHDHKRTRFTGSVFQAKNGTWYGFVAIGRALDGRRIRKKLTGHSKEAVERDVLVALEKAGVTPPARPRPLSNRSVDQLRRIYREILRRQNGSTEP